MRASVSARNSDQIPATLTAFTSASGADAQITALKQLKNDIIGHDVKKELVIRHGAIELLGGVLSQATRATGKRRRNDINGGPLLAVHQWSTEDELCLQAILVLGTIASATPSFTSPIVAAGVVRTLIEIASAEVPPRLTTAILQALKSIVSAWSAMNDGIQSAPQPPIDIFTQQSIESLFLPIMRNSQTYASRQQVRLVLELIALAAVDDTTKSLLTQCEVVDALAALLVAYSVAQGHIVYHGDHRSLSSHPVLDTVGNIVDALANVISGSIYRTQRFVLSTVMRHCFLDPYNTANDQRHLFGPRHGFVVSGNALLPPLHIPAHASTSYHGLSRAFPALSGLQGGKRGVVSLEALQHGCDPDHANAVCSYLILLARATNGFERLGVLRLLALVSTAIDTDVADLTKRDKSLRKGIERTRQVAMLGVPLAVQLIHDVNESTPVDSPASKLAETRTIKEQACGVLALLVDGKQELQAAAVEAGAVKHVCPLLRKSFDPVSLAKPTWVPNVSRVDTSALPETRRIAPPGLPREILHAMQCRKTALAAIAALAAKEDSHRKAIVEAGVVPCIIDALKPYPPDYLSSLAATNSKPIPKDGNTVPVILAACGAAKSMSRSVAALRTSLIDAGLGKPILALITHPDVDVQIAATDVCANLVLEFSALRDDFLSEETVKTIASHARSSSTALRLPSLWALKHLVLSAPREMKLSALEELGAGWLVSAIQGQQRDSASTVMLNPASVGLSTANAAGEQVDLLNPSSMDLDQPIDEAELSEEDSEEKVSSNGTTGNQYQESQLRSTLSSGWSTFDSRRYLASVYEIESNENLQARRDDVAIQEQALDFIRNLLNGQDDCAFMFDHLITQIGSAKIFELLTAKLAPVATSATQINGSRQIYNPTELILSSIHIINHIANCSSKHKQLLIAQKPLLQAWLPHFSHSDRRVRVHSVWTVNSLTWIENDTERSECSQRARELRAVGIESAIRALQNDPDLDVRERVKTAVRQIDQL